MKKFIQLFLGFACLVFEIKAQTITDIDGNIYNTIVIGAQEWVQENLKTTHFRNGDPIPTTITPIYNDTTAIYQWCYDDDSLNINTYGRLYSWYALNDSRNVCPAGWHVPTETDWLDLANFLGGDSIAGGKMKEAGTTHWSITDSLVTNSSGFTGLPGGFRANPSTFINISTLGFFWCSTAFGSGSFQRAYTFRIKINSTALEQSVAVANCGLSVRCVKDISAKIENSIPEDKIRIFPNPTSGQLNISFDGIEKLDIFICDISGSVVFQGEQTSFIHPIDLSFLSAGIYTIRIVGSNINIVRKLIKE